MGNVNGVSKKEVEEWRKKYGLEQKKVESTFDGFRKQSENGQISYEKFVQVMKQQSDGGVGSEEEFARQVFQSFDRDNSGFIDIREYMALMGVVFGDNLDEKLEASFKLFDEDGNGELSRDEVKQMLIIVTKSVIKRRFKMPESSDDVDSVMEKHMPQLDKIVEEIFEKVDTDKSGTIDRDEFKIGFREHPKVCKFFKQF